MKIIKLYIVFAVLIVSAQFIRPSTAEAEENASAIVKRADAPFLAEKMYSIGTMTIYRSGNPRPAMEIETYSMNRASKYYSLTIYKKPARLKGTAYLIRDNDLWVRFASTGRVRKLSSSARENSAGGSDFSYNDMGESGKGIAADYNSRLLDRKVQINGKKCYQIQLTPKDGKAGYKSHYKKIVVFIDRENYRYLKIDYYRNGANIKSLYFSNYKTVKKWDYPFKLVMENHTKPTKTVIVTEEIELDSPRVKDSLFTTAYLKRIR